MKNNGTFKDLSHKSNIVVQMRQNTIDEINYFINSVGNYECQWFMRIYFEERSDAYVYHIDDMYIPTQTIRGAYVESPLNGFSTLFYEVAENYKDESGEINYDDVNEVFSNMNVWCHSHVNMTAAPSGTDNETFADWYKNANSAEETKVVVMMIVNKKGEMYLQLKDPVRGIHCIHPNLVITPDIKTFPYIDHALEHKITKAQPVNYAVNFNRPVIHTSIGLPKDPLTSRSTMASGKGSFQTVNSDDESKDPLAALIRRAERFFDKASLLEVITNYRPDKEALSNTNESLNTHLSYPQKIVLEDILSYLHEAQWYDPQTQLIEQKFSVAKIDILDDILDLTGDGLVEEHEKNWVDGALMRLLIEGDFASPSIFLAAVGMVLKASNTTDERVRIGHFETDMQKLIDAIGNTAYIEKSLKEYSSF